MNYKATLLAVFAGLAACGSDPSSDPAAAGADVSATTAQVTGTLLFTSDTHYPVLTRGAGNTADLILIMVDRDR